MLRPLTRFAAIVGQCTLAAVAYGLVHDQVTIRVCPEYFTVAHPRLIGSDSLTLIALAWGVFATWWVGAGLGVPMALASRVGKPPRVEPRDLWRPLAVVLGTSAATAVLVGLAAYLLAHAGLLQIPEFWAEKIPPERHHRFLAAGGAHLASYWVGAASGLVLIGWILGLRCGMRRRIPGETRPTNMGPHDGPGIGR